MSHVENRKMRLYVVGITRPTAVVLLLKLGENGVRPPPTKQPLPANDDLRQAAHC
jgi:hypothetical protein